jgi:malate dehydrogenase
MKNNKRPLEKDEGRKDAKRVALDGSDSDFSVDAIVSGLDLVTISELSLKYRFVKEVSKDGSKIYLRFIPNDKDITLEEKKRDSAAIFQNIKKVLGDQIIADSEEIRKRPEYITFTREDLIDIWSKRVGVQISSPEIHPQKTIAVIGSGDVGESVVKDFMDYHERRGINCKIVWVNRNQEYVEHRARDLSSDHLTSCVGLSTTMEDCKNADLIVMTAGVKAGRIGAVDREKALIHNLEIVDVYSHQIKAWAKKDGSTKLAILTNPVEIVAQLMSEETGFAPENIIALGTHLDTKRYVRFLEEELNKIGCRGQEIKTLVLGRHSANGMIFQPENITFGGEPITRLVEYDVISQEQLNSVLRIAEEKSRAEGIVMSKSKYGKGSYEKPAKAAVEVVTNWLYGPEMGKEDEVLSVGIFTRHLNNSCYLGFPVKFAANGTMQIMEEYLSQGDLRVKLQEVAQDLAESRAKLGKWTDYLVPLSRGMNRLLEEGEKRSSAIAALSAIGIYSREDLEKNLSKITEIYDISKMSQLGDQIKISVKGENSRFSNELFGVFFNALNAIGMVDKTETPRKVAESNKTESFVIKVTKECVDLLRENSVIDVSSSSVMESSADSPSTAPQVKQAVENLVGSTSKVIGKDD